MKLFERINPFKKKKKEPPKPVILKIQMPDGSIQEYPENFKITDGVHCVICSGNAYHNHFECHEFRRERKIERPIIGMTIKDAKKQGIKPCYLCEEYDRLDKVWDKMIERNLYF